MRVIISRKIRERTLDRTLRRKDVTMKATGILDRVKTAKKAA